MTMYGSQDAAHLNQLDQAWGFMCLWVDWSKKLKSDHKEKVSKQEEIIIVQWRGLRMCLWTLSMTKKEKELNEEQTTRTKE